MPDTGDTSVARAFVDAVVAHDGDALEAMLDPAVDFRGMTPGRTWEAGSPAAVRQVVLGRWFEPDDRIEDVLALDVDAVGRRTGVRYRLAVRNPAGAWVVEQQAYLDAPAGRIAWIRILCSGFQPAP